MAQKVTIRNQGLFTRAISYLKDKALNIDDDVLPLKDIFPHLAEVGVNLGHKIRLQFQYTEKIGFFIYLIDFTKPDEENPGDTRENFHKRIRYSKQYHSLMPEMFPENILAFEELDNWGWYLSFFPDSVKSLKLMIDPQDLDDLQKQIELLVR